MIFVDTSVWIEFLRGRDPTLLAEMKQQLEDAQVAMAAPVRIEVLAGVRASEVPRLRRALSALPVFYPSRDTWDRMEEWALKAATAGKRFGMSDLLIASLAAERGGQLWSLDDDFREMARLRFVKLFAAG